jgi:uncharacterized lipoprotein YmbA
MNTRLLALATLLLLTACSAVPVHYYTLMPAAEQHSADDPALFQFQLSTVRIPVQADQPELVVRQGAGQVAILENERWSAPLADEFNDALSSQLEQRLGVRILANLPIERSRPVLSLQADVKRFETAPGNYVLIDMVWTLSQRNDGQQRRTLTCSSQLKRSIGLPLTDAVEGHQALIAQLAKSIAGTARHWSLNPASGCPDSQQ